MEEGTVIMRLFEELKPTFVLLYIVGLTHIATFLFGLIQFMFAEETCAWRSRTNKWLDDSNTCYENFLQWVKGNYCLFCVTMTGLSTAWFALFFTLRYVYRTHMTGPEPNQQTLKSRIFSIVLLLLLWLRLNWYQIGNLTENIKIYNLLVNEDHAESPQSLPSKTEDKTSSRPFEFDCAAVGTSVFNALIWSLDNVLLLTPQDLAKSVKLRRMKANDGSRPDGNTKPLMQEIFEKDRVSTKEYDETITWVSAELWQVVFGLLLYFLYINRSFLVRQLRTLFFTIYQQAVQVMQLLLDITDWILQSFLKVAKAIVTLLISPIYFCGCLLRDNIIAPKISPKQSKSSTSLESRTDLNHNITDTYAVLQNGPQQSQFFEDNEKQESAQFTPPESFAAFNQSPTPDASCDFNAEKNPKHIVTQEPTLTMNEKNMQHRDMEMSSLDESEQFRAAASRPIFITTDNLEQYVNQIIERMSADRISHHMHHNSEFAPHGKDVISKTTSEGSNGQEDMLTKQSDKFDVDNVNTKAGMNTAQLTHKSSSSFSTTENIEPHANQNTGMSALDELSNTKYPVPLSTHKTEQFVGYQVMENMPALNESMTTTYNQSNPECAPYADDANNITQFENISQNESSEILVDTIDTAKESQRTPPSTSTEKSSWRDNTLTQDTAQNGEKKLSSSALNEAATTDQIVEDFMVNQAHYPENIVKNEIATRKMSPNGTVEQTKDERKRNTSSLEKKQSKDKEKYTISDSALRKDSPQPKFSYNTSVPRIVLTVNDERIKRTSPSEKKRTKVKEKDTKSGNALKKESSQSAISHNTSASSQSIVFYNTSTSQPIVSHNTSDTQRLFLSAKDGRIKSTPSLKKKQTIDKAKYTKSNSHKTSASQPTYSRNHNASATKRNVLSSNDIIVSAKKRNGKNKTSTKEREISPIEQNAVQMEFMKGCQECESVVKGKINACSEHNKSKQTSCDESANRIKPKKPVGCLCYRKVL